MRTRNVLEWALNVGFVGVLAFGMLDLPSASAAGAEVNDRGPNTAPVWRIATPEDISAPVQRAAVDPVSGAAYLATLVDLFEVRDGRPVAISKRPHPDARLLLAPEGGTYAWLVPDEASERLFFVSLFDITGEHLADVEMKKAPYGIGGLYLGARGRLVVTVSALDDWQGSHGRFLYGFWSRDGNLLGTVIRPEREIAVVAADGQAFLLLGKKEALAFSPTGELLWRLDGRFRKAAAAAGGKLALLNPADHEAIDRVFVFRGSGRPTVVTMPTPVHKLRLTPDGTAAVVTGSEGRYFFLDPAKGRFEEGARLPFEAAIFISDVEFVDRDTIAFGVLERDGDPPQHSWPRGAVLVLDRNGHVKYRSQHSIREPFSSRPAVDTSFAVPKVIGFTLDEALLVAPGR